MELSGTSIIPDAGLQRHPLHGKSCGWISVGAPPEVFLDIIRGDVPMGYYVMQARDIVTSKYLTYNKVFGDMIRTLFLWLIFTTQLFLKIIDLKALFWGDLSCRLAIIILNIKIYSPSFEYL